MKRRSDCSADWDVLRNRIIGLGEKSIQKSYYPQLQRKLEELELFRSLLNYSSDFIFLLQVPSGFLTDVNDSAFQALGYSRLELLSKPFTDLFSPDEADEIRDILSRRTIHGPSRRTTSSIYKQNGESIPVELTVNQVELNGSAYAVAIVRDCTERKRLEERLNRAEKMEGLGRLAGGVAHDLNNVLGALVGYAELMRDEIPQGTPLRQYVDNMHRSGMRGAAIIQDLLTLARRGVAISEIVNLNQIITDYFKALEFENIRKHHKKVTFRIELGQGLLNIKGSPVHLGKTFINLVSNAAEAIPGEGEVVIQTENRHLDRPVWGYDDVREGDYVVLIVSDNGKGIARRDIGKIFEPFYTKKVMGRSGTGLGLAVVWGTVKDHNGYIDVQSEEGAGSIFTLYFPVTREEAVKAGKPLSLDSYAGRGESILVVDDVEEQRDLALRMMKRLGYRVSAVASGEEAVAYIQENRTDLIILDMIMDPGIDGLTTYERIREFRPGQKAIIVSGFSETERVKRAQSLGAGAYIQKPYILENLGLAVRDELDRRV